MKTDDIIRIIENTRICCMDTIGGIACLHCYYLFVPNCKIEYLKNEIIGEIINREYLEEAESEEGD